MRQLVYPNGSRWRLPLCGWVFEPLDNEPKLSAALENVGNEQIVLNAHVCREQFGFGPHGSRAYQPREGFAARSVTFTAAQGARCFWPGRVLSPGEIHEAEQQAERRSAK